MEPADAKIMLIAFIDAWYVIDAEDRQVLSGPHDTHEDAEQAAQTRAYRIQQGWQP